jgi:hypothetical protein
MSLLTDGLSWLSNQLPQAAGQAVTYFRGEEYILIPDAVQGQEVFESEGDDGRLIRSVQIDWIIHKDRLQVDAVPFAPEVGDRIVSADGNYEVQLLGDDPCFRRATEELYRIHVRKIASA